MKIFVSKDNNICDHFVLQRVYQTTHKGEQLMHTRFIAMIIATTTVIATGAMAAEGQAAKGKGGMKPDRRAAMLKQFDTDNDGKLSKTEKEAMRAARQQKMAEMVKQFDKNGDGKLDDAEKQAMIEARKQKAQAGKKAKGKGKRKAAK